MADRYPILVLGGYGAFGGRVCRRLAGDPLIRLLVAGRSKAKAERFAATLRQAQPGALIEGLACDAPRDLPELLAAVKPKLVIHTCGPFQGQDYAIPRICIDRGVHYLDLADDRAFVTEFETLDIDAMSTGVLAVTGASTLPGLSFPVVASLKQYFRRMRDISIGITPGNRAPRGPALVAAILSYTGKPIPRWRDGAWTHVHGWQDLHRRVLAAPQVGALGPRWFAACDVPDMALLPERYCDVKSVSFHAGLELPALHLGLWLLSWSVRGGMVRSLAPLAGALKQASELFTGWGSDRGGMFVEVSGEGVDGRPLTKVWTLIAGAGDGPFIPGIPAVILARKLARNQIHERGAMACLDLMTLEDFETAVADLDIAFETV